MTASTKQSDLLTPVVQQWLIGGLPEAVAPLRLEPISGGYSMLTFRVIDADGQIWVLRLPPAGQSGGGAHDPVRESRTMAALWESDVPVPRVRITGTADDPLGVPCHVTDFVDGHVISEADHAASVLTPETLRLATANLVTTLATLHAVDPDAVGLGDLGPKENYNGRQVRRWHSILSSIAEGSDHAIARRVPDLRKVGDQLGRLLPVDTAGRLVHGDYRLGNTITTPDGTIQAVLDWELVTRGEPLADLGTLLTFWDPPQEAMLGTRVPTLAPGSISPDKVVSTYADHCGADVSDLALYRALACWRLACLTLRTAVRFTDRAMNSDTDPEIFLRTTDVWTSLAGDQLTLRS